MTFLSILSKNNDIWSKNNDIFVNFWPKSWKIVDFSSKKRQNRDILSQKERISIKILDFVENYLHFTEISKKFREIFDFESKIFGH